MWQPACEGAGLARDAGTEVYQSRWGDAIAGKPAPTQARSHRGSRRIHTSLSLPVLPPFLFFSARASGRLSPVKNLVIRVSGIPPYHPRARTCARPCLGVGKLER
ncbi:hypothetical protein F7R12_05400 [Pseudomonas tolaasii]|nr:hypothetical protein F7R12_05400 [Pseudomonas tolaasii]